MNNALEIIKLFFSKLNFLSRKSRYPGNYFYLKGKNAEKLIHDLAVKTFLTDWCFLNPKLPDGNELCDLLVVFDETIIIWQIKDLKLDKSGRYKKSEVEKNLRQLSGARRQLFDLQTSIELENPRRTREQFNPDTFNNIYLISVLLGEGEEFFSSMERVKGYDVHVFTRESAEIILNELDTISDFTQYLEAKEEFLSKNRSLVILGGEEEMLAYYLINNRSFGELNESNHVLIQDGLLKDLQGRPEYKAKKQADEISYGWDNIIDRAHEGSVEYERVARELARPNRFHRRYLSKIFIEAHMRAHSEDKHDLF